ncbi:MAG: TIGR00730 family Rossman fold protein [Pseudomonadota bacterium]|nr:TIGR00730 family Rossman fold protein [Pseudomonadota bacterium]
MSSENNRKTIRVCVFCGSREGNDFFLKNATRVGRELALRGLRLVYGGGSDGLMGAVALAYNERGGKAIGVIPEYLDQTSPSESLFFEKQVVENLFERKKMMIKMADAFIALPGGIGTLDEISEVLALLQLNQLTKPLGLLNLSNYYAPLVDVLDHFKKNRFLDASIEEYLYVSDDISELLNKIVGQV